MQIHKDYKEVKPIIENHGRERAIMNAIRKEGNFEQMKLKRPEENPSFQSQKYYMEDSSIEYGLKDNIYYFLVTSAEILKEEELQGKQGKVKVT
ncbi:hypothetical protein CHS0354_022270 [Potamilus streckersoni]|uniref:Uncharacterized protein n=1 Tax=Potamilus streckersoni TaxID=2493646 RepID=A0AAE0RYH5_9BIVA|nr:hypothetical protein CHS0354_022270 [Potamilus streckersoni]